MAFDITKKRAVETGDIELEEADGSPMTDDKGKPLSVTVYSPGSKIWQQANAEMNRKRAERMRKNGGKIEAALDSGKEDIVNFLTRITVSFNGWTYPTEDKGEQAVFRAAYSDDLIGYIRDHVYSKAHEWGVFTNGSGRN